MTKIWESFACESSQPEKKTDESDIGRLDFSDRRTLPRIARIVELPVNAAIMAPRGECRERHPMSFCECAICGGCPATGFRLLITFSYPCIITCSGCAL